MIFTFRLGSQTVSDIIASYLFQTFCHRTFTKLPATTLLHLICESNAQGISVGSFSQLVATDLHVGRLAHQVYLVNTILIQKLN